MHSYSYSFHEYIGIITNFDWAPTSCRLNLGGSPVGEGDYKICGYDIDKNRGHNITVRVAWSGTVKYIFKSIYKNRIQMGMHLIVIQQIFGDCKMLFKFYHLNTLRSLVFKSCSILSTDVFFEILLLILCLAPIGALR